MRIVEEPRLVIDTEEKKAIQKVINIFSDFCDNTSCIGCPLEYNRQCPNDIRTRLIKIIEQAEVE